MSDVALREFKDLPSCVKMYIYLIAWNKTRFIHLDVHEVVREISHISKDCLMIFHRYIECEPKQEQRSGFRNFSLTWEHPYVKLEEALELALAKEE